MKLTNRFLVTLVCGAALGAVTVTGLKAQVKPPAYVIVDISEMTDVDAFTKALSAAEPQSTIAAGGRYIVRSSKPVALDGVAPYRFVIIAFDDEEKAKAWYKTPALMEVNGVRMKVSKSRSFIVEGLTN